MAMKARELRELTVAELRQREAELTDKLFSLRLQRVTGQLEKPSKVGEAKRDRARVLTVIGQLSRRTASK